MIKIEWYNFIHNENEIQEIFARQVSPQHEHRHQAQACECVSSQRCDCSGDNVRDL